MSGVDDRATRRCCFCSDAAQELLTIVPARYRSGKERKVLVSLPVRGYCCARHAASVHEGPVLLPEARLRRKARGVDQLDIYS
jgi:hypothetical protein